MSEQGQEIPRELQFLQEAGAIEVAGKEEPGGDNAQQQQQNSEQQQQQNQQQEAQQQQQQQQQQQASAEKTLSDLTDGKFKSKEELDAILTEIKTLKETPKFEFASDEIRALDEYVKKGGSIDGYNKLKSYNLESMEDMDYIKAEMRLKFPKMTDDMINSTIRRKYFLADDASAEDKQFGEAQQAMDAENARKYITEHVNTLKNPVNPNKEIQESNAKILSEFTPKLQNIVKGLDKLSFTLNTKGVPFEYSVDLSKYGPNGEKLVNFATSIIGGIKDLKSVENMPEQIQAMLKREIIADNIEEIVKLAAEKSRSMNDIEWAKEAHGENAKEREQQNHQHQQQQVTGEQTYEQIMTIEKGKRQFN